jgi:flagellar biosynthesis activator protein FlaF
LPRPRAAGVGECNWASTEGRNRGPAIAGSRRGSSFASKLWNAFIQDLADPENDLPDVLRADLVSVGLWIIKEAALIRSGQSQNFRGVIDICTMIRDGLK